MGLSTDKNVITPDAVYPIQQFTDDRNMDCLLPNASVAAYIKYEARYDDYQDDFKIVDIKTKYCYINGIATNLSIASSTVDTQVHAYNIAVHCYGIAREYLVVLGQTVTEDHPWDNDYTLDP